MNTDSRRLCPWCHQPARLVWVHGHGQCEHCRINVEPCCAGDECPALPDIGEGENPGA